MLLLTVWMVHAACVFGFLYGRGMPFSLTHFTYSLLVLHYLVFAELFNSDCRARGKSWTLRCCVLAFRGKGLLFQKSFSPLERTIRAAILSKKKRLSPGFCCIYWKTSISLQQVLIYFAIHTVHSKHNVKFSKLH